MPLTTTVGVGPEVVRAARLGDRDALAQLLAAAQPNIRRFAQRSCRTSIDVDDAVQEALWLLTRRIGTLRVVGAFWAWLFAIVTRECLRLARRVLRGDNLDDHADRLLAQRSDLDLRMDVAAALQSLPEHYRSVILLRDVAPLPAARRGDTCAAADGGAGRTAARHGYRARCGGRGGSARDCRHYTGRPRLSQRGERHLSKKDVHPLDDGGTGEDIIHALHIPEHVTAATGHMRISPGDVRKGFEYPERRFGVSKSEPRSGGGFAHHASKDVVQHLNHFTFSTGLRLNLDVKSFRPIRTILANHRDSAKGATGVSRCR